MKTLIDRITKRIDELKKSTCTKSIVDELERVKAELTAVKGVDELVEKYSKSQGIVNVRELISDLKSLKQTAVTSQKELDDRDNDLANIFNTAKQTGTKGDLFINIMDYLVSKGFLQKGVATEETLKDSQPKEVEIKPYKVVTKGDEEGNTYGCTRRHCGKCKAHITYMNKKDCDKYCSKCGSKINWIA